MPVQIMTTEEWYTIMWGLIDAEFRYSSIYFYAVIVFGSYFFWNIFINGVIAIFLRLNMEQTVRAPMLHGSPLIRLSHELLTTLAHLLTTLAESLVLSQMQTTR
jgi:hypothetical protein